MTPQERLAYAIRLPETDRTRRARIEAALEDIDADYAPCGARLVKYVENYGRHAAAPVEPEPMHVDFSATIENADSADINIKVTR